MRYTVPQPDSSVHAVASNNARTPHTTCVATAGFTTPPGDVSVNMRTMRVYLVGGAVRDRLLGVPVRERDWVRVGAHPQELEGAPYLPLRREFPVFLHPQTHEEYALARLERKVAPGYRGFTTQSAPEVTLEEDLKRRDLTINAMAKSEDGQIVDPYGGRADLPARVF